MLTLNTAIVNRHVLFAGCGSSPVSTLERVEDDPLEQVRPLHMEQDNIPCRL